MVAERRRGKDCLLQVSTLSLHNAATNGEEKEIREGNDEWEGGRGRREGENGEGRREGGKGEGRREGEKGEGRREGNKRWKGKRKRRGGDKEEDTLQHLC